MKIKRRWVKIVLIVIVLIIGTKTYLEIDAYIFKNKVEKTMEMEFSEDLIKTEVTQKTLQLAANEIHYFVAGQENKDLIIFFHPAFSDHRAFDQQIDFFSKDYCVITVDFIGHGLSKTKKSTDKIDASPTHINKIIEAEGFDKAHLIGVSMGSLLAQYFAYQYPEKTRSLTALGSYNIHKENKEVAKAQRSTNFNLIVRALFSMNSFRKKAAQITCKSDKGQALFFKAASLYDRKSFLVMQGLQNVIKTRKNNTPHYQTLILTGEFDIDLAKTMAEQWHSELENSTYLQIDYAGHCANIDEPDVFNKIVKNFIDRNN